MAWKRTDDPTHPPEPIPVPPRPAQHSAAEAPRRPEQRGTATIGPSIFVKGDLSGEEDLVVEGRVEGKIDLKQNNVTVGRNGRVCADVFGRVVVVEGEIDGNVFAQEQAILRQSGALRGNITAPRVILEDGSRFRGTIDMEPKEPGRAAVAAPASPPDIAAERAVAASAANTGSDAGTEGSRLRHT